MLSRPRNLIAMGFGAMLLLLAIITVLALVNMSAMRERVAGIVKVQNVKSDLVAGMRNIARERSLILYQLVLSRDPFAVEEHTRHLSDLAVRFLQSRDRMLAMRLTARERQLFEAALERAYASTRVQLEAVRLMQEERFDAANQLLGSRGIPAQNRLLAQYDAVLDALRQSARAEMERADATYRGTITSILVLAGVLIAVGLLISVWVTRRTDRTDRQLRELNATLEERVTERTRDLSEANRHLEGTVATLREAQKQLVQAEKMAALGSLVAGISHEINTPLGVSLTAATQLEHLVGEARASFNADALSRSAFNRFLAEVSEGAALVARNNERAAELIRGFKQIAVDQSSDEWREIDLRDYVDETLASLRPRLRNSPVEVSNAVEAGLTLYTHPGAIYQIVSNLVLNALSHAYAEGQAGRVEIAARRDGDEVALECRDDGGGIAPEHLGRVFEPFFTTRLGQGGSGLGLSIVYNLVTGTLRGRIEVDSAPDAGTRFRIRFPVQVPAP